MVAALAVLAVASVIAIRHAGGAAPGASTTPGIAEPGSGPELPLEVVATGLQDAVGLASRPDDPSGLYVVRQRGLVERISLEGGARRVVLDISDRVVAGGEQGLLGLAFHPDHGRNGLAYVHYTDRAGDVQISELRRRGAGIPAGSERPLLRVPQPGDTHNGGAVAFGPDGHLYVGLGDGGGIGGTRSQSQFRDNLLGTIIRIDPRRDGSRPYRIPPDNPFRDGPGRPEIYVYGLRNPWRFAFDGGSGDLWIGDVGHDLVEEVTVLRSGEIAGANLGWDAFEGTRARFGPTAVADADWVRPVVEYGHDQGCSVTGGEVLRGPGPPSLRGRYVFSDFCSGTIWSVDAEAPTGVRRESIVGSDPGAVTSFGIGPRGALYVASFGRVHRFAPGPP